MFAAVTFAAFVAVTSSAPDRDPDIVRKSFVIIKATPSYAEARALAAAAAERLAIRLDLRELVPDVSVGLTFSQDACASEFGEFPCYVPRGRWDDGVYLSVEHSSAYEGFEEGPYVVMLASGSPRDRTIGAACAARRVVPGRVRQDRARVPGLHPLIAPARDYMLGSRDDDVRASGGVGCPCSCGPAEAQIGGAAQRRSGTGVATSSTTSGPTEATIDCDGLIPMTKQTARRRLFGLFQEGDIGKGRWVEFKREPDLNAAVRAERVFEIAQVWQREDGATAVSMRLTSS